MLFKNLVLLLGSLVFYAYGEPVYVLLMLASILINYALALGIDYYDFKPAYTDRRTVLFSLAICFNLGMLFFFKYEGFAALNINRLISKGPMEFAWISFPVLNLSLPLGISFYTFQILSYIIDVFRRRYHAEKNILYLGMFITLFPQLIAGPIVTYPEIRNSFKSRKITSLGLDKGIKTFILGLAMKVLLANPVGGLWTELQRIGYESISTPLAWMGALAYSFQIYFDFYGYSLMAIGLGEMLGFSIPENFNDPYSSKSATEFWQRWHITLGKWFREYVYIPMGGNRVGKIRMIINLFVVWTLTGLWHGADWNFVLWGFGFFVILTIEKIFLKKYLDKSKVFSRIYMILLIPLSWTIFAISDFNALQIYFSRLFPFLQNAEYESNVNVLDFMKYGKTYGIFLLIGIALSVPKVKEYYMKLREYKFGAVILFGLFVWSIFNLSMGLDNPFLYFRF